MRRLVWLGILFACLWSGWWLFAATTLQSGIAQWLEERRAEGWQADLAEVRKGGFPLSLDMQLIDLALADPQTGVAIGATTLDISAPTWWPGHATVSFPSDEMVFASPLGRRTILAKDASAALRLKPSAVLELEEMALTSGPWTLAAPNGTLMAAQGLTLRMKQSADTPTEYDFILTAPAFEPGNLPRRNLRIPHDWPTAFDNMALDMTVVFDRPFDRTAIETARPQPRRIDLRLAEAVWGGLSLRSAATLAVSEDGRLDGEFSLQARNWQDILEVAETAGVLPAALRPQMESILGALARGSGNPDTIDICLSLREGTAYLGFIPLGPAPRLILR